MKEKEKDPLEQEWQKTFWYRFFTQCALFGAGGFLAFTILSPFLVLLHGWASQPSKPHLGCMDGKPAKVISTSITERYNHTLVVLKRGNQPTFICEFSNDLLFKTWVVGEVVYHPDGWRE